MFRYAVHTILLLFLPTLLFSNNVDSLKQIANQYFVENNKPAQLKTYLALGDLLADSYEYQEALSTYHGAIQIAEELKKQAIVYDLLNQIGLMHFWQDEYAEALQTLQKAQLIKSREIGHESIATNHSRIAEVYISLGIYDKALEQQLMALNLSDEIGDFKGVANAYRVMSSIYWYQKDFAQAEVELKRALKVYEQNEEIEDKKNIYTCYAALSSIYTETGKLKLALEFAEKSLAFADKMEYPYGRAFSTGMIGAVYKYLGDLAKASEELNKAIDSFHQIGIVYEATDFQILMAEVLYKQTHYEEAIVLLTKLDSTASALSALPLQVKLKEALASNYAAIGKINIAYEFQKSYAALKDSLFSKEKLEQISLLESRYKLENQKQFEAIEAKDGQIRKEKGYILLFSIVFALCVLLIGNMYLRYKNIKREQLQLKVSHDEMTKAHRKLSIEHTEMQRMAGLLSREINDITLSLKKKTPQSQVSLEEIEEEDETAKLDQLLVGMQIYQTIEGDHTRERFLLSDVISEAVDHLPLDIRHKTKRIRLQNLPHLIANRTQITQLFEHLIANAIKFNETEYPEVLISCDEEKDAFLIKVKDEGMGIPEVEQKKVFNLFYRANDVVEGSGAGLTLAKKITEQHQGEIWLESHEGKGTTVFVRLPKLEV